MDKPGLDGVDLAAQVRDVGLDDAVVTAEVVAPHVVEDLPLGQHPAGVGHQVPQQLELGRRQGDPLPAAPHLVRLLVQFEVGEGEPGRAGLAAGAPQDRADPGGQLLQAERLGDVVVAAEGQPADLVVGRVPGGQEDHRGTGTAVAQLPDDLEAVQVGEHDVEDDEVRPLLPGHLYRAGAVGRGRHRESGEARTLR